MAYTPNEWKDQVVQRPKTYQMNNNDDGSVTLIDSFGLVTELGTPVNADYMNHIEEGIANCYNDLADKDLSNLSPTGEKHFINKNQITNCILSAPNGVATYSGNTITVKSGLKVLIPNGRNADKTLNNIEYTLMDDVTRNLAINIDDRNCFIFLDNENNTLYTPKTENVFYGLKSDISLVSTTLQVFYYAEDENLWYMRDTNTSDWNVIFCFLIGTGKIVNAQVISLLTYQPVELAKQQDIDGMWTFSAKGLIRSNTSINPRETKTFDLSDYLPADGNIYEVLFSGSIVTGNTSGNSLNLFIQNDNNVSLNLCRTVTKTNSEMYASGNALLPVGAGRNVRLYASSGSIGTSYIDSFMAEAYRKVR